MHTFVRADSGEPLILPRPKTAKFLPDALPFRITPQTRIVRTDGSAGGRRASAVLQNALHRAFGIVTPIVSASPSDAALPGAIYVGLCDGSPRFGPQNVETPRKPEGYGLAVDSERALLSGRDDAGVLWAAQTFIQLFRKTATGGVVVPARVADYPTLSLRAVHLFHGQKALPFHEKLIERVFSPFKMNALFIQAEQVRWDTDPNVAPDWAGTKADLAREITFARAYGLTMYPLLESFGHMEWLFNKGRNQAFAEDPQTPYAVNVTNPQAVAYLEKFNREADALFNAPGFHIGFDEVTMRGRFPYASRPSTFPELFIKGAKHWHDFFAKRNKETWIWADMLLHPSEVTPSFGTAPSAREAALIRAGLPKDLVVVDWQYSARPRYPSLDLLKRAGFTKRAVATWYDRQGIQNFARAAAENGALGAIQTTWAGYESRETVLDTPERKQFTAMVTAADYFWNGGDGPTPDKLPYDADAVFAAQWR